MVTPEDWLETTGTAPSLLVMPLGRYRGLNGSAGLSGRIWVTRVPTAAPALAPAMPPAKVSASSGYAGGLVGQNIKDVASTGTGSRAIISASYSTGTVSAGERVGGLVGSNGGTIYTSYWDTSTSARAVGVGSDDKDNDNVLDADETATHGADGKTTAEIRTPRGYTGIYASWNIDLDGDGRIDDPWEFGTSSQFPTLNAVSLTRVVPLPPARTRPPALPRDLSATADGQTEIDLSWTAPSDDGGADITGYKIEVLDGRLFLERPGGRHRFHQYQLYPHRADGREHPSLPGIGHQLPPARVSRLVPTRQPPTRHRRLPLPTLPRDCRRRRTARRRSTCHGQPPLTDGGADITGYKIEVSTDGSSWSDLEADTDSHQYQLYPHRADGREHPALPGFCHQLRRHE